MGPDKQTDGAAFEQEVADLFGDTPESADEVPEEESTEAEETK